MKSISEISTKAPDDIKKKMDVPLLEAFFGIVQTFILGWLIGVCIAAFYNAQIKRG